MADYSPAIDIILANEGGLTEDPNDRGGITNYGVCLRFAKDTGDLSLFDKNNDSKIDREDIKLLTKEDAAKSFKKYFWDKFKLDNESSDKKALVIFDIAVNHGNGNAANMIQKSLVELGFNIEIDGKVGPKTLGALSDSDEDEFVDAILSIRGRFYNRICEKNPSQKVFLKGWMNRIKNLRITLRDYPPQN